MAELRLQDWRKSHFGAGSVAVPHTHLQFRMSQDLHSISLLQGHSGTRFTEIKCFYILKKYFCSVIFLIQWFEVYKM